MLMLSSIFLLLSNAVNSQREASLLYSRIAIFILLYPMWFVSNQTIYLFLNSGIALFNGLFHINSYTLTFCHFLFILSSSILILTGFLHIKIEPTINYKSYNEFTDEYKTKFIDFYRRSTKRIHSTWYRENYIPKSFHWTSTASGWNDSLDVEFNKTDHPQPLEQPYSHETDILDLNSIPNRLVKAHARDYLDTPDNENEVMVYISQGEQKVPNINEEVNKVNSNQMYEITEYPLIVLFVITGSIFLLSSSDLLSVFLSVELQSYGLYLLSSSFRNSETATGGGLTYFLLGGLSSTFILLGASFIYANCGNTLLENLYIISDLSQQTVLNNNLESEKLISSVVNGESLEGGYDMWYNSYYLHLSLVMAAVGFLFKVSAAPFHFWSPDVYDAIPTVVTTFVAIVAKISIFIFLLDLVYYTSKTLQSIDFNWTIVLLVSSFLSLIIGSVLGLTQHRIKRLYAYSTISHVGFILLALAVCSVESIQSYFFYIMQYSLSNLNAFLLLLAIGYTISSYNVISQTSAFLVPAAVSSELANAGTKALHSKTAKPMIQAQNIESDDQAQSNEGQDKSENTVVTKTSEQLPDKANSPVQLIRQLQGYSSINPMLAVSLIITLFSFIGVPPLLGFFAKQMVLSAALDKGYFFVVLIAILTSVISAVYYLAVVKNIFFDTANGEATAKTLQPGNSSKDFLTHFFFIITIKYSNVYFGDFPLYEVDSDTRKAYTTRSTSFNIDDIILRKEKEYKFDDQFAKDYQFSAYSINYKSQLTGPLNIIISFLSLLILLFMFTPVEWLNLSSILSLSLFYF